MTGQVLLNFGRRLKLGEKPPPTLWPARCRAPPSPPS
jgi:hypothetical protein